MAHSRDAVMLLLSNASDVTTAAHHERAVPS